MTPDTAMPPRPPHMGLPEQRGANAAHDPAGRPPLSVRGWRSVPGACTCAWRGDHSELPATRTLDRANPACKVHGTNGGKP